jgi:hypothetical protein
MSNITAVAKQFFEACETGKGWEGCRAYCTPDASFSAQAEPLADIRRGGNHERDGDSKGDERARHSDGAGRPLAGRAGATHAAERERVASGA